MLVLVRFMRMMRLMRFMLLSFGVSLSMETL